VLISLIKRLLNALLGTVKLQGSDELNGDVAT
jgi:hypothetical protein